MATTKKPVAKKPTTKAAASKKAPAKKAPVKKVAPRKASTKKTPVKATTGYRSFKVSSADMPFASFKITRQTMYWVILIAFIIFVQLWILKLQIDVATLLEQQQADLLNSM